MGGPAAPVLIERALLLGRGGRSPDAARIERVVAFQRRGHRIVLVAPKPSGWRPTRRSVDHDLALQQQLHQLFTRAGAELDGVLYLGTGLFSRKHRQKNEFEQTAQRYGRNVGEMTLIGSDQALIEAADRVGLKLGVVGSTPIPNIPTFENLKTALANVD
ncbi:MULTISPECIES: hypothetical protein [unclassified Wenzhouxiangella]|uniref:hypothetical protein n=1 Tax=unclassified Wenzhouxiangella TaxID=2613841 RepID=UPI000E32BE4E|nr:MULTISPECIES: hypothetical protein [unclassified Wenzhouxiangella]RFF26798.1 hypothetical protein DZK25_11295 [Wenzhouxiangella sp. 15181]RFP67678.1 hypothetical protein DZK26_11490 [Wenzhouxiangella sp. 15190]